MSLKYFSYPFFLFLLDGIAGVFSFSSLLNNFSLPDLNNSDAIRNDWAAIAADYNISMQKMDLKLNDSYKKSEPKKKT
jgi:hypothetical protein